MQGRCAAYPYGQSQAVYAYPGCDAGTTTCPNDVAYRCAQRAIRLKYEACSDAGDCAIADVPGGCVSEFSCPPPAVAASRLAAYVAEASAEVARYCDGSRCRVDSLCAFNYELRMATCRAGRCVAVQDDGGIWP